MNKKLKLWLVLIVLVMNIICISFNTLVEAQGTIYIKPDGTVDPLTAPIQRTGNTYTFTNDVSGSIVVEKDNVVVDGAGHKLQGTAGFGSRGIELIERKNVTIKNMEISAFHDGILLLRVSDSSIVGIKILNIKFGLMMMEPSSSNNSIINNTFTNSGLDVFESYGNRVENNTVNGKPLVYLEGVSNRNVSNAGQVILVNCTKIMVENQDLSNTLAGLQLLGTNNSIITGNRLANNVYGITLTFSSNNTISRNNMTAMYWYGISTSYAPNNIIVGNKITNNKYGIDLGWSSNNTLSGNVMSDNKVNIILNGWAMEDFVQTVDVSNLVNGKPIYYLVGQKDLVINRANHPEVGFLALVECTNVTVEGLTLTGNHAGLLMAYSNNSKVKGNNIVNNDRGIDLFGSSNNIIVENNLTNNDWEGIHFEYLIVAEECVRSSNNTIVGNKITNNDRGINISENDNNTVTSNSFTNNEEGIFIQGGSTLNSILENNITNNQIGISIWHGYAQNSVFKNNITNNIKGIKLESSSNINVIANNITNNDHGVWLTYALNNRIYGNSITANNISINSGSSDYNSLCGNNITAKWFGIWLGGSSDNHIIGNNISTSPWGINLYDSSNNIIYCNNFVNNIKQVYDASWDSPDVHPSINVWDDGYPSGGNYWSDYMGVDKFRGPSQNESGNDGIGDAPYKIDNNNTDRYPLMKPLTRRWAPPDIAVTNVTTSKTIVGQGLNVRMNVSITNLGQRTEDFNVTVYATGLYVMGLHTQPISLQGGNSATFTFTWDTTFTFFYPDGTNATYTCDRGNYTIWTYAWPILDEINMTDNTLVDGLVTVTIPGDINADGKVNILDVSLAARAYGTKPGNERWNANADLDENGTINILDISLIARRYGKTI